ncbi:MAG: UvrD-helicase domain-containing protein [Bacilli bacterium]|nr:UvrD-helicase domain-containing protein [Bacilli bacterium]
MEYNEKQIEAIESLENTIVIAGAGAGKTATIVGKIYYLIKHKICTEKELLVISFTNEAVNSLKQKICYNIDIKTFHKLALDIIQQSNRINLINDNYLDFIINEYLNSYALYNKKTNVLYKRILKDNTNYKLKNTIKRFITIYKSNFLDITYLFKLYKSSFFINKIYYKIILDIFLIYQRELESTCSLDLNDLLIKATHLVNNNKNYLQYKFIIIDEFQDTSNIRFNLIKSILNKNKAVIFAVGDDYQSIYRFTGCDLSIFLNFKESLNNVKEVHLNYNYRNCQELINVANKFIIKNKKQIPKEIICIKNIKKPIKIIFYTYKCDVFQKMSDQLSPDCLVLGRNNHDKEEFHIPESNKIKYLTIHKAKGLEADDVVVVNLKNEATGLPSKISDDKIISKLLKTEHIIHEEERRLFYVALTRAKRFVYLLVPKHNYSVFVKELIRDYSNYIEFIDID